MSLLPSVLGWAGMTLASAGLYSFWMRTRLRRRLWSSVRLGGLPFEYDGTPSEKMAGLAIAAAVIGVWLGLVTMVLIWVSLHLFLDPTPGAAVSVGLLMPVYFAARYRGLRYLTSRTRWRGIRFWMEPGWWGYGWRATLWTLATAATAGLLLPLRARALWRYRAERAHWGNAAFDYEPPGIGSLYVVFLPFVVVVIALGLGAAAESIPGILFPLALLPFAWAWWRLRAFNLLASGLRLRRARLTVAARFWPVVRVHLLGWLAIGVILLTLLFAFGVLGAATVPDIARIAVEEGNPLEGLPAYAVAAIVVLAYGAVFILRGALSIVFVAWPLIRHAASTAVVSDAGALDGVRHGEGARMADADGFANLFDFGGGI